MSTTQRPQRSDAARNRQRLLSAAVDVFAERGLDAGVAEIAARAQIGRATLFRNFPTKQDLIAAVVVEKMLRAVADGRRLLADEEGRGTAVFAFLKEIVHRQQRERALFEAIADQFLSHADIRAVQTDLLALLDDLLDDGRRAGTVRPEVGAVDVMLLIKGVCSAASELGGSPELLERHLALITAAISTPEHAVPLTGRTPTVADMSAAHSAARSGS
ncbi:MAG TPA: helix-turn-helix domain-containing protein [Solirubrobacteraceae bacterium]|jgi:AcrR family transcriptional regulator|nr:helix-turn-helix domain-containing protein [Solirubrobacteraceae bacterium]